MSTPEEQLAEELARLIAEVDQPPPNVISAADGAFTWRLVDLELAALIFDSAEPDHVAPSRGGTARRMTFEQDGSELDVEVHDERLLVVSDAEGYEVGCHTVEREAWRARIDDGECEGPLPSDRPLRLVLTDTEGSIVLRTPWIIV